MRLQPESRAPARPVRRRVRRAVHHRQARHLRLPRLPVADPPAHLPPHEPRQPPRPRLQGGGHDHDAVRHGRAQRPRPLPPRDRRHRPRARARRSGGPRPPADGRQADRGTRVHAPATARTCPRSRLDVADRRVTGPARILVVNAGSSSLKLRVLDRDDALVGCGGPGPDRDARRRGRGRRGHRSDSAPIDAVGHRVVHGGMRFTGPAGSTTSRRGDLRARRPRAAPPAGALAAIDAVRGAAAGRRRGRLLRHRVPRDDPAGRRDLRARDRLFHTAFHAGLPQAAATYALPAAWRERWAIRRFGFHGLSHAYASRRAAELLDVPLADLRIVTCHLGAGASLAAVRDGRSVDTTMGFTPLEGLVMATRSGTVDPGLVLWLAEHGGLSMAEIGEGLERESGLLGPRRHGGHARGPRRRLGGGRARRARARRLPPPAAGVDRGDGGVARRHRCAGVHRRRRRALGAGPGDGGGGVWRSSASRWTRHATTPTGRIA